MTLSPFLTDFLLRWAVMSFSLWVASHVFRGLKFDGTSTLLVSALLLGFANAILKPILFVLTLPLTILTLGLFYLALNAFMIMLVARMVDGFRVSGFWTALFASIFIAIFGALLEWMIPGSSTPLVPAGTPSISI